MTGAKDAILALYAGDASGRTWLEGVAASFAKHAIKVDAQIQLGQLQCPPKLKYKINPSNEFLRWLIENNHQIVRHSETETQNRGFNTLEKRERLFAGCEVTLKAALTAVDRLTASLKSEWWRFEGPCELDCVLLTQTTVFALIFFDTAAEWPTNPRYPQRHHLLRLLDCTSAFAQHSKRPNFYVGHIAMNNAACGIHANEVETIFNDSEIVRNSLPHLSPQDRENLINHYLGCIPVSALPLQSIISDRQAE